MKKLLLVCLFVGQALVACNNGDIELRSATSGATLGVESATSVQRFSLPRADVSSRSLSDSDKDTCCKAGAVCIALGIAFGVGFGCSYSYKYENKGDDLVTLSYNGCKHGCSAIIYPRSNVYVGSFGHMSNVCASKGFDYECATQNDLNKYRTFSIAEDLSFSPHIHSTSTNSTGRRELTVNLTDVQLVAMQATQDRTSQYLRGKNILDQFAK